MTKTVAFCTLGCKVNQYESEEIAELSRLIEKTNTMSVEDWIEANIFAGYEISFHHYGILRSLAIYLYYEKNIPYEKFYNSVVELCRNSDKDILNHTTTATTALETKTHISTEETTVAHLDILYSTGHLAADHEAAMSMEYDTVVNNQVLAWPCSSTAVLILS